MKWSRPGYLIFYILLFETIGIYGCKDNIPEENKISNTTETTVPVKDTLDTEEEDAMLNDTASSGEDLP